jgi:hypothetical protein
MREWMSSAARIHILIPPPFPPTPSQLFLAFLILLLPLALTTQFIIIQQNVMR